MCFARVVTDDDQVPQILCWAPASTAWPIMMCIEWLQLMSLVRDRVRGRAPLLLVFSGALLLVMGGWPVRCTAMPKDLLLFNGSSSSTTVKCESSLIVNVDLPVKGDGRDLERGAVSESSGDGAEVGGQLRTTAAPSPLSRSRSVDDSGSRATNLSLSRSHRSVSSINSSSPTKIRLRQRVHGGSAALSSSVVRSNNNNSISSRPRTTSASNRTKGGSNLERNERSANLSHINAKIQLFIKNRLLQILPDGTVNGTQDDSSDYSE